MTYNLNYRKSFLLILAIAAALLVFGGRGNDRSNATANETYDKLKLFSDVFTVVKKDYVEEVTTEDLVYGAIRGMLQALDPHSSFMPPDMYKEIQVETKGKFGGLGIEITIRDGVLTVVSPIEGTPAFKEGIQSGDRIIKIEKTLTKNLSLMDAVKMLRGKPGTKVTISILRENFTHLQDFTITRDIIRIKSVKSRLLENNIGYVRITQFQESTIKDFKNALNSLNPPEGTLKGMVIDLRNNPGGLLNQAVAICDEFLESGLIVYTEGRNKKQQMKFAAHKNKNKRKYPLVVLVNAGSASGSEIVAGALQDHGRALILGTQTFGKGSVQTIIPLADNSGLRLTTAKYYTPNGNDIQARGIIPDIVVADLIKAPPKKEEKARFLREKDLLHHFRNEGKKKNAGEQEKDKENKGAGAASEEKNSGKEGNGKASNKEKEEKEDPPLERALQILKSWQILSKNKFEKN